MPDKPLAHPLTRWQFYGACFRFATTGAWGTVGNVSTILAFAPQLVKTLWPHWHAIAAAFLKARGFGDDLLWKFPLWIGGAILLARLLTAPFLVYRDKPSIGDDSVAPVPPLARPRIKLEWSGRDIPFLRFRNDGDVAAHLVEATITAASGRVINIERVSRVGPEVPAACWPVLSDGSGVAHPSDAYSVIEFLRKAATQGYISRAREERRSRAAGPLGTPPQAETDLALMELREIANVPLPAGRVDLRVSFDVVYCDFDRWWRYATPHVLTYRGFEQWVTIDLAPTPEPQPVYIGKLAAAVDVLDVRLEGTFPGTFALHATGHACEIRTGPIIVEAACIGTTKMGEQTVNEWTQRCAIEFKVVSDLRDGKQDIEPSLFYGEGYDRGPWPDRGTVAAMTEFIRAATLVRSHENGRPDFNALSRAEIEARGERMQQPFHFSFDITFWNSERTRQWRRSELLVYEPQTNTTFVRHSGPPVPLIGPSIGT